MSGVLLGGWVADCTEPPPRVLVVVLTVIGAALMLWVDLVSMWQLATISRCWVHRRPRDRR